MKKANKNSDWKDNIWIRTAFWSVVAVILLFAVLFVVFWIVDRPRQHTLRSVNSTDNKYTIDVDLVDYGATAGYKLKGYVRKNFLLSFRKEFTISSSLRKSLKCKEPIDYAECPTPFETFEIKDDYILWYGEKIKFK